MKFIRSNNIWNCKHIGSIIEYLYLFHSIGSSCSSLLTKLQFYVDIATQRLHWKFPYNLNSYSVFLWLNIKDFFRKKHMSMTIFWWKFNVVIWMSLALKYKQVEQITWASLKPVEFFLNFFGTTYERNLGIYCSHNIHS